MKKVYLNPKQVNFIQAQQPTKVWIGGRGSGKSTVIGNISYLQLGKMPRSKIFFTSPTYAQILTKTLPAIEDMWGRFGLKEYVNRYNPGHYVVGRRPPAEFVKPFTPPRKFTNVISFWNGFTIEFISLDRPDLARGGSYDGGFADEAALIKQDHFAKVIMPSVRGNRHRFKTPLHHQVSLFTSMPWNANGYWLLEYMDKMQSDPERFFYMESTAEDNIHILGQEYIDRLRDNLPPLTFAVEVMNQRINKVEDQFYHKFDEDIHTYIPAYNYTTGERGIQLSGHKDHNPDQMIEVSMDFSGWFNGMICFQEHKKEERAFDSFFVKNDRKINELIDDFCEAYKEKQNFKMVRVWGEPRGHDKQPNSPTLYEQIKARFQQNGWGCEIKAKPMRTTAHISRHYVMNELLAETNPKLPRFRINKETCKDVIIAIQLTQVRPDFRKNKSKEKDRNYPQEHAPHFTDMLDYYLYEKHSYKSSTAGISILPGSVAFG